GRHAASDPEVAEWTMTVTHRERRRHQYASRLKLLALTALRDRWPEVERTYSSIGVDDEAMNRIYSGLNAEGISQSEAWELALN
ncbi:MAG: GNAT family acetyltransferase, partial [Corynebacterium casei]